MQQAEYIISGETIGQRREKARIEIAKILICVMGVLMFFAILVGSLLLWKLPSEKFDAKDMLNLVLATSSIFSGLLGSAITFYFSSKN